jgi:hypothetical protein
MKYLQPFSLYEAAQPAGTSPIMDAMTNTPEGRDLAALCSSYRVDRTGKLVMMGMRGRTYIQEYPDDTWKHWVLATGRTYGEGFYPTLIECIRGCWTEYVMNSTSIRPPGMQIKEYKDLVTANLNLLEGQALSTEGLKEAFFRILCLRDGIKNPIRQPREIVDAPKWSRLMELFDVHESSGGGDFYDNQSAFRILTRDSQLVKLFLGANSDNNFPYQYCESHFTIRIKPGSKFKRDAHEYDNNNYYNNDYYIAGEVSQIPEYADLVFKGVAEILLKEAGIRIPAEFKDAIVSIKTAAANLILSHLDHASGSVHDLETDLLRIIQKMYPEYVPHEQASVMRKNFPNIWQRYVDEHPDPDSVRQNATLGDFGFF